MFTTIMHKQFNMICIVLDVINATPAGFEDNAYYDVHQ